MSDVDVTVFYDEHRVAAMERALKGTRTTLEDRLGEAMRKLYEELIPAEERERIETHISQEQSEEYARQQSARRFSLIHFHDADDDFYFTSELTSNFYSMANRYRYRVKDEIGLTTLDGLSRHFVEVDPIDEITFSILSDAMHDDPRIRAIADFDFENNTVSILNRGDDEWHSYDLKDVSVAAYKADRKSGLSLETRQAIFEEALDGKELAFDDAEAEDESEGPVLQM